MNVKHYGIWSTTVAAFFLVSLNIGYVLPVKYVLFGQASEGKSYPISTVKAWENKIQTWDWVSGYRIEWRFPHTLLLHFDAKTPVAKQSDGLYIASDGDLFHLSGYDLPLVGIDVQLGHIPDALAILFGIQESIDVRYIHEDSSGIVLVETMRGDQVLFNGIEHPPDLLAVNDKVFNKKHNARCYVLHRYELVCGSRK